MTSETFHYVRKVGGPGKEGLKNGDVFCKGEKHDFVLKLVTPKWESQSVSHSVVSDSLQPYGL